jgi:hypothetical protein
LGLANDPLTALRYGLACIRPEKETTMANQKLRIIYRSNTHAPLWLVAEKSGC